MTILAVDTYDGRQLADTEEVLNLSWTSDEGSFVLPELREAVREGVRCAESEIGRYFVADPYGNALLSQCISEKYQIDPETFRVACGAGVGGLLFALAAGLSKRKVYIPCDCYPDFPEWLQRFGSITSTEGPADADTWYIERPSIRNNCKFDNLEELAELTASTSNLIIVDESNSNYLPDSSSAINLIRSSENLIVLRGLSKGFLLGGLRFGCAVFSIGLETWSRMIFPPLQTASFSLSVALSVLKLKQSQVQGLWQRIKFCKIDVLDLIEKTRLPVPGNSHPALPYIIYEPGRRRGHAAAIEELLHLGIVGKNHIIWSGRQEYVHRYSVPLTEHRLLRFKEALKARR